MSEETQAPATIEDRISKLESEVAVLQEPAPAGSATLEQLIVALAKHGIRIDPVE